MKPKEGTILTVAKGWLKRLRHLQRRQMIWKNFSQKLIEGQRLFWQKTPDMLPVLKEAGVVDSGGQGLLEVLRGAYDAFLGKRD